MPLRREESPETSAESVRFQTKADLKIETWTVFALCVGQWRTMTTLLDLKSSVLRQVQRSQSLRTRRESPPTPSSPLAHRPEPLPRRWVAGMQTIPPTWHPGLFLPFFFIYSKNCILFCLIFSISSTYLYPRLQWRSFAQSVLWKSL